MVSQVQNTDYGSDRLQKNIDKWQHLKQIWDVPKNIGNN